MPYEVLETQENSFSLNDALAFQETPKRSSNERGEAVAELRNDQQMRQEEVERARKEAVKASNPVNGPNSNPNAHRRASPLAMSAMKPLENNLPGPRPPSAFRAKNGSIRYEGIEKRIVLLKGMLEIRNEEDTMRRKSYITGTWKFKDDTSNDENPKQKFKLVSKNENITGEPQSGMYEGHFYYLHPKVSTKFGKTSWKAKKMDEKSVKLEFRKLDNYYRIQGYGKNEVGDFSLNGKAKPIDNDKTTFKVELRKNYQELSGNTKIAPKSSKSSSVSTVRASQDSIVAKPAAASTPRDMNHRQSDMKPPSQTGIDNIMTVYSDSDETESETDDNVPKEAPRRRRELPDIPRSQNSTEQVTLSQISTSDVGTIDGKGQWRTWTRNFDDPFLALLDIFDNAVDASWTLLPKARRQQYSKPKIRVDIDRIGSNGVVMRNASKFIPPIQQVLQVCKSTKTGEGDQSIGENGVGVKQACASLSDLSFVFTKTTDPSDGTCTLSMGILMKDLQRYDGIVLPSVAFPLSDASKNGSLDEIQEKLEEHCFKNPDTWGKAVQTYGNDDFGQGVDQCIDHMDVLRTSSDWKDSDNVFAIVFAKLTHTALDNEEEEAEVIEVKSKNVSRKTEKNSKGAGTTTYHTVQKGGETDVDEDEQRSMSLLKQLRKQLPHLYLHLHDLDICVEHEAIESIFWERRLAELTKFELQLPQTEPWNKSNKARNSANYDVNSVLDITNPKETVRFFCGFDPYRCKGHKKAKNGSASSDSEEDSMMNFDGGGRVIGNNPALQTFLYSRQSGRLIRPEHDQRTYLGLTAGSTEYCQGLTIIIDDYNGTLPLNPTKQDTAFGHSKQGGIHRENLREWTGAIAYFYWQYHLARFGSSKVAVTEAVSNSRPALVKAYKNYCANHDTNRQHPYITPLCKGKFITYPKIEFCVNSRNGIPKLRVAKTIRETVVPLIDEVSVISRLDEEAASQALSARPRTSQKKRTLPHIEQEGLPQTSPLEVAITPAKRSKNGEHSGLLVNTSHPLHNQETNALLAENQQLKEQLRRYQVCNTDLELKLSNSEKEAARLRQQLGTPPPSPYTLKHPPPTPTSDRSELELDKLRREVQIYKSRADFYKKEVGSLKRQIETLREEKSRFEDRVQELEDSQLSLHTTHEELLQF